MLIPLHALTERHGVRPRVVVHAGAHRGEEADAYAAAGAARVLWVEGNPDLIAPLSEHLRSRPGGCVHTVVCALLAGEEGTATLHVASNGESSSTLPFGTHAVEHPEVTYVGEVTLPTVTLDTVAAAYGFADADFLNLDLQGVELDALRGAPALLSSARWVYSEVNEAELYEGCGLLPDLDELLAGHGFRRVATQMTRHGWGDALWAR